jgi:hypothetical protein
MEKMKNIRKQERVLCVSREGRELSQAVWRLEGRG